MVQSGGRAGGEKKIDLEAVMIATASVSDMKCIDDEGRHSEASHLASRRLLWSHYGRPTAWLLLLVAACTLVFIKSAEVHQEFACRQAPNARVAAVPAPNRDATPEETHRRTGDLPRRSC